MSVRAEVPPANPIGSDSDFSTLAIRLLKGVVYREADKRGWRALVELQGRVRDYVGVLGLDLVLDEDEGYALLRPRVQADAGATSAGGELIPTHAVSLSVALLLATLRKALADFDAQGGGSRLVLTQAELGALRPELLAARGDEARTPVDIQAQADRLVELGFLRRLVSPNAPAAYEVQRVLSAIIDTGWLRALEQRLASVLAAPTESPRA